MTMKNVPYGLFGALVYVLAGCGQSVLRPNYPCATAKA